MTETTNLFARSPHPSCCGRGFETRETESRSRPMGPRGIEAQGPTDRVMVRMLVRAEPFVYPILRVLLGGVFLYASYDKILNPAAFSLAVYNYQILPDAWVNLTAVTLPWLELLLGLCLVAGVWLPGAMLITTGLLASFTAALIFNLTRGLDVHCGCFSTDPTGDPANLLTVARDLTFLAVSMYLTLRVLVFRSRAVQSLGRVGKRRNPF